MTYIEAPNDYNGGGRTIFMGGGITDCRDCSDDQKRRGRKPWTPPVELLTEYSGSSVRQLSFKYGVSTETIKHALRRGGVQLRPLETLLGTIPWTDVEKKEICREYTEEQKSILDIAVENGVSSKAIHNLLIRCDVKLRKNNTHSLHHHTSETKEKQSVSKLGCKNPNYGKGMTDRQKELLRKVNTGKKHSAETLAKMSKTRTERGLSKGSLNPMSKVESVKKWIKSNGIKPNKAESRLKAIIDKVLPDTYELNVEGDRLILGGKIPDFVCTTGQKKVIELYGDYWHKGENPEDRISFFSNLGYQALVIWEKELKSAYIQDRICAFHGENQK